MQKLIVFNSISLDGCFTGENGDLTWAHSGNDDAGKNRWIRASPNQRERTRSH
jgi:hypothetical protein